MQGRFRIPVDLARRFMREVKQTEFYQIPNNYGLSLPLFSANNNVPTNLSRDGRRLPTISFIVQASLANTGLIMVGGGGTNLNSGLEMDPGKALLFSAQDQSGVDYTNIGGAAMPREMSAEETEEYLQSIDAGQLSLVRPPVVLLNIADFFAASDTAGQTVRVFWSTFTRA